MNSGAARIVIMASAFVAVAGHGWCAQPAAWAEALGHFASSTASLTNTNLAELLEPTIVLAAAPCSTARMPGPASMAPVSAALIVYQDDAACNSPTPLVLLQISLDARPPDVQRMKAALTAGLSAPCFAGELPHDPRRHAPLQYLVAWRRPGRVVTLATQEGEDGGAALSVLQTTKSGEAQTGSAAGLVRSFVDGMPPGCR